MKCLSLALCLACTLPTSRLGFGLEVNLPAGTPVSVTLAEPIDSDRDAAGKRYQATLSAPIALPGGQTIPAGSRVTISLVHNNSGWITQLTTIVQNGRTLAVLSSAGAVFIPGQETKPDPNVGLRDRLGLNQTTLQPSPQVQLASSTQLRFYLVGTATVAHPVPVAASRRRSTSPVHSSAAVSRASTPQPTGIAYLCRATDTSEGAPNPYYVADVQKTMDKPALVERSWYEYLAATYPYRFANNSHAKVECTRLSDAAAERAARRSLQGDLSSEDPGVIHTPWRYSLGPPPAPPANAGEGQGQPHPAP